MAGSPATQWKEREMATCQHTVCTCEAAEGSDYCSPWCEANPDAGECHCHHSHCQAPHHH
jgi:hypothetical protein